MIGIPADRKPAALQSAMKKQKIGATTNKSTATIAGSTPSVSFGTAGRNNGSIMDGLDLPDSTNQVLEGCTENGTPFSVQPLFWQWKFEDSKFAHTHICICVCLPSGICRDGQFRGEIVPSVASDGLSVTIRCLWPSFFTDIDVIQMGLERANMSHDTAVSLKMAGVKELNSIRKGLNRSIHQPFVTTTVIPLKQEVETSTKQFVPIFDRLSFGMCVVIVLKVRESEIGELKILNQPFAFIDKSKKGINDGKADTW
jgi:hypothetical protein